MGAVCNDYIQPRESHSRTFAFQNKFLPPSSMRLIYRCRLSTTSAFDAEKQVVDHVVTYSVIAVD